MKLIDANLIIYAYGKEHPYREPSGAILDQALEGTIEANVSAEVLQEVLHYYHRHGQTYFGLNLTETLLIALPDAYQIDQETVRVACSLLTTHPRLQTRDAFHAATVFQHNLEGIISADRAFDTIKGLTRFDPKELAA